MRNLPQRYNPSTIKLIDWPKDCEILLYHTTVYLGYKQHPWDLKNWLLITEVAYNRGEVFGSFHSDFITFYLFFD